MPGSFCYRVSQAYLGRYYCEEPIRLMADLINIGMSRQSTKRKELLNQNNLLRGEKNVLPNRMKSYHMVLTRYWYKTRLANNILQVPRLHHQRCISVRMQARDYQ